MAKISISLPDALKDRLDHYAAAHGENTSHVIQKALEAFLEPPAPVPQPTPPPPSPTPAPPPPAGPDPLLVQLQELTMTLMREVHTTQRYLGLVAHQQEHQRQCLAMLGPLAAMGGVLINVPGPLPEAPWLHPR